MPRRPATVRARGMGAELRELREKNHLTTREVARRLGWSASTVSRTETGHRNISSEDVAALLALYGVAGEERDRLLALAREANQPGWWETQTRHPGLPAQLTALIGFESQATRITDVELILVPGLLQTPEYTRALMEGGGIATAEAETRIATRLGRQALLSRPQPPEVVTIIDEAALRRPVGGGEVMAKQLHNLARAANNPNITIQVIPYSAGAHPGVNGSFVLMEFAKAPTIVHLEHKRSSLFLDDPDDIAPFSASVATLRGIALNPDDSVRFLTTVAAEYES